jgi:hypothetical protein
MSVCGIVNCFNVTNEGSAFCERHQTGSKGYLGSDFYGKPVFKEKTDMVNHPPHYTSGNLEVIDILKDQLTPEEYEGFLKGNILKYTLRYRLKNGLQDLEKSEWYLKKLIEHKKDA